MSAVLSERQGYDAPADTLALRAAITAAAADGIWNTAPPAKEWRIGGVRCLVFDPGAARGTVLHMHGGAFRIGQPEQVGPFSAALAARCSVRVVCPAYRLAPEHPFPAALNDCRAVLVALAAEGMRQVLLSGDSAGGGLAASLALLARNDEAPPIGLALLSAWLDLRVITGSFDVNANADPMFSTAAARTAAELYLQGHNDTDPLVSPLLAPGAHFPPSLINVGDGEVLLDDSMALHERLLAAGVESRLDVVPGMQHVAATRSRTLIGAEHTFEQLVAFVADRLGTAMPLMW